MPPCTITLGMMRAVTRGRDPCAVVVEELASFLEKPSLTNAQRWVASTEHEERPLTRGDVLWSGSAPILCSWLYAIPLFAVPYGTPDRNVLRPQAVFIGSSPRYKQHQGLIWYSLVPWVHRWCEGQQDRLVMLAKRDKDQAYATVHVYAPRDGEIVADYWRTLDVSSWQMIVVNVDRPDRPSTARRKVPPHHSN